MLSYFFAFVTVTFFRNRFWILDTITSLYSLTRTLSQAKQLLTFFGQIQLLKLLFNVHLKILDQINQHLQSIRTESWLVNSVVVVSEMTMAILIFHNRLVYAALKRLASSGRIRGFLKGVRVLEEALYCGTKPAAQWLLHENAFQKGGFFIWECLLGPPMVAS